MAASAVARGSERRQAGPINGNVGGAIEPGGEVGECLRHLGAVTADRVVAHQRGAGLAERAGGNRLTKRGDAAVGAEADRNGDATAARR